jgi:hypothetical protein
MILWWKAVELWNDGILKTGLPRGALSKSRFALRSHSIEWSPPPESARLGHSRFGKPDVRDFRLNRPISDITERS